MKDLNLTLVLRWLGVTALLGAGVSFMLEGWQTLNSVEKYSAFLGFSVVLWLGGWASRKYFGDEAGAKTFFGSATAVATVNFVQLGAFIYSSVMGEAVHLPEFLRLPAPEIKTLIALATLTVATSIPIIWSGFRALIREPESSQLAALYFLLNALFLIPSREPSVMGPLVGGAFLIMFFAIRRLQNFEIVPVALASVPFLVLIGRSLFHPADYLLYATYCFIGATSVFWAGRKAQIENDSAAVIQGLAVIPMIFGWLNVDQAYASLDGCGTGLLISLSFAVMSFGSRSSGAGFRAIGALIGAFAFVPSFFDGFTLWQIILSIVVSVSFTVLGYVKKEKFTFFAGVVSFVWFMIHHLWYAVQHHHLNLWFVLGVIGVIILSGATILEKKYKHLGAK